MMLDTVSSRETVGPRVTSGFVAEYLEYPTYHPKSSALPCSPLDSRQPFSKSESSDSGMCLDYLHDAADGQRMDDDVGIITAPAGKMDIQKTEGADRLANIKTHLSDASGPDSKRMPGSGKNFGSQSPIHNNSVQIDHGGNGGRSGAGDGIDHSSHSRSLIFRPYPTRRNAESTAEFGGDEHQQNNPQSHPRAKILRTFSFFGNRRVVPGEFPDNSATVSVIFSKVAKDLVNKKHIFRQNSDSLGKLSASKVERSRGAHDDIKEPGSNTVSRSRIVTTDSNPNNRGVCQCSAAHGDLDKIAKRCELNNRWSIECKELPGDDDVCAKCSQWKENIHKPKAAFDTGIHTSRTTTPGHSNDSSANRRAAFSDRGSLFYRTIAPSESGENKSGGSSEFEEEDCVSGSGKGARIVSGSDIAVSCKSDLASSRDDFFSCVSELTPRSSVGSCASIDAKDGSTVDGDICGNKDSDAFLLDSASTSIANNPESPAKDPIVAKAGDSLRTTPTILPRRKRNFHAWEKHANEIFPEYGSRLIGNESNKPESCSANSGTLDFVFFCSELHTRTVVLSTAESEDRPALARVAFNGETAATDQTGGGAGVGTEIREPISREVDLEGCATGGSARNEITGSFVEQSLCLSSRNEENSRIDPELDDFVIVDHPFPVSHAPVDNTTLPVSNTTINTNAVSSPKPKRPSLNYLKTISTAFRRIYNPSKEAQRPGHFRSYLYDLEHASATKVHSCPTSPGKMARLKKSLQFLSSSPLSSRAPSASPVPLRNRGRSMSVDSCCSGLGPYPYNYEGPSIWEKSPTISHHHLSSGAAKLGSVHHEESCYPRSVDALIFPDSQFDAQKVAKNKVPYPYDGTSGKEPKKAQQFGLTLQDVKQNTGRIIPQPVEDTIEYLKASGSDEVEGLFRRCARVSTMREVQEKYDNGEQVNFHAYGDPHLAAAVLKKFLRELQEPLMTYDLFEPITRLHFLEPSKQVSEVQRILRDELAEDNYIILKFVFQFLQQVVSKSSVNFMTAENIATVFGPNIAWPKGQANLASVEQAVKFALILVQQFDDVFLR